MFTSESIDRIASKLARRGAKVRPPLAREEVEAFEAQAGIELPQDYVDFISRVANGGVPPTCCLVGLNDWSAGYWIDAPSPRRCLATACICTPTSAIHGESWIDAAGVDDWSARFDRGEWDPVCGSIAVAEIGCGLFFHLVVCGENRGRVFSYGDHIKIPPRFEPESSFSAWLERSLDGDDNGLPAPFLESRFLQL